MMQPINHDRQKLVHRGIKRAIARVSEITITGGDDESRRIAEKVKRQILDHLRMMLDEDTP